MRQHIIRILPVLFLSGILLSSCNQEEPSVWSVYSYGKEYKQVHEETNGFDITYQFAPDVIRYEKEQANTYIISVEEDATVVVSAGAPSSFLPHVGSILSAGITQTTPRGLGNKVVEIMEADGTLRCKTEPAPLDEIFTELEISGSTDLGSAMAEGYEDEDGYHEFEHYTLT